MTAEELKEFDALNAKNKRIYKYMKDNHPEWKHSQIMTYVKTMTSLQPKVLAGVVRHPIGLILREKIKEFFK